MNINYYNTFNSKIRAIYDAAYMAPNILLADKVYCCSTTSSMLLLVKNMDSLSDQVVLQTVKEVFCKDNESRKRIENLEEILPNVIKLQKTKNKDKVALSFIGRFKSSITLLRNQLKESYGDMLYYYNLENTIKYVERGILELSSQRLIYYDNEEDIYISQICNDVVGRETILSFDTQIDNIFSYCLLDSVNDTYCDFIKIPIFSLPPMLGITYAQLNLSREELSAVLLPFKENLKVLSEQLFEIEFVPANFPLIKNACEKMLSFNKDEIQKTIDQSAYLNEWRKQFPEVPKLCFCIGITSASKLVDYYEKMEILQPYVTTEIKQNIGRLIDLQSTHVFSYYEMVIPRKNTEKSE